MANTLGNVNLGGNENGVSHMRHGDWYDEDKVKICFEEIMRVAENNIDLTHVANDLKRLRFRFPSFRVEVLDTICQVLLAVGIIYYDSSREMYIWVVPRKSRLTALGDAQGEETDFDRFVKDKMVHRLQMLRVALDGLTTNEKKNYWCASNSSCKDEKRPEFKLAYRVTLFVIYEAYNNTEIVFHDYQELLSQSCSAFEHSPVFYEGWEKEVLPLVIAILSHLHVFRIHDEVSKGVNGMPPKKKPEFIECLINTSTKKNIRKHKNNIHFTSRDTDAHSGSSSGCCSSGSGSKVSSDGRYSQKNGSVKYTEQAFISAPTTSFETSAKKSHNLGKNSLVNKHSKMNEQKCKGSRGISASRFIENLVKKNPKIARHTLFRGLESEKQAKLRDEGRACASTDSNDNGKVKVKENLGVEFIPMEFDRTTMELTEIGNVQNESKKYLNQGVDDMNMIEFFGKMRYYPFDLQDNRIF